MYVRVEPSGCDERKGLIQVRFAMHLEPVDYGYDKHYVQVPEREYTQMEIEEPALRELVPKVWQNNPFHNHFVYVEPDITERELMDISESFLNEAYIKWATDSVLDLVNPQVISAELDVARQNEITAKLKQIKKIKLERRL